MVLKQTNIALLSIFAVLFSVVGAFSTSSTTQAYQCTGTPDDYYTRDPGTGGTYTGDAKAKITPGQRSNLVFAWDDSQGRCTVTVPDLDNQYKSENADGSFKGCATGDVRNGTTNNCSKMVTYSTNDKPVRDDGTKIPLKDISCGAADAYDEESFACKQTGKACNVAGSCDYHKVGLAADTTAANEEQCKAKGGTWKPATRTQSASCTPKPAAEKTCVKEDGTEVTVSGTTACPAGSKLKPADKNCTDENRAAGKCGVSTGTGDCGGAKTNLIPSCDGTGIDAIGSVLKLIITIMTFGIGLLAVGGIVYGAILYASAQDNAGQTKKAIEVITNTVLGLLLYLFMIAILNWLVPGGVIG